LGRTAISSAILVVSLPSIRGCPPRLYFEDPDGHSLEYIALLPEGPEPELGAIPLSRWRELHQQTHREVKNWTYDLSTEETQAMTYFYPLAKEAERLVDTPHG
jgi:hypothetical protein